MKPHLVALAALILCGLTIAPTTSAKKTTVLCETSTGFKESKNTDGLTYQLFTGTVNTPRSTNAPGTLIGNCLFNDQLSGGQFCRYYVCPESGAADCFVAEGRYIGPGCGTLPILGGLGDYDKSSGTLEVCPPGTDNTGGCEANQFQLKIGGNAAK